MKKLFSILAISLLTITLASAQSTTPRFGTAKNQDNTGRTLTYGYTAVTLAATDSVNPNAYKTVYAVAKLTGAKTIKALTTNAHACDEFVLLLNADTLTAGRVVTFGKGIMYVTSTLTVDASQKASIGFIFDGVIWREIWRAKQ